MDWRHWVDCCSISYPRGNGLFVRRKRTIRELIYVEQERDNFRKQCAKQSVRLNHIDPERFIDRITELRGAGEFDEMVQLSESFSNAQSEAFGMAAEILTEQAILDSGKHDGAAQDAIRFAAIGLAAQPDSPRLQELQKLANSRAKAVQNGEPIDTLNWDGLADVELHEMARSLEKAGKYQLAEIAARRAVPLAYARTGQNSSNYAAALGSHGDILRALGDYGAAEPLYHQAVAVLEAALGADHPNSRIARRNLQKFLQEKP